VHVRTLSPDFFLLTAARCPPVLVPRVLSGGRSGWPARERLARGGRVSRAGRAPVRGWRAVPDPSARGVGPATRVGLEHRAVRTEAAGERRALQRAPPAPRFARNGG